MFRIKSGWSDGWHTARSPNGSRIDRRNPLKQASRQRLPSSTYLYATDKSVKYAQQRTHLPLLYGTGFLFHRASESSLIFVKFQTRYRDSCTLTECTPRTVRPPIRSRAEARRSSCASNGRSIDGWKMADPESGCLRKEACEETILPQGISTYSAAPNGRKYCVPLTGSCRRRRSCWRSALRSTKSISEVLMTSRSDEE